MPIYCRKCRMAVPDVLASVTSTQCPNCLSPISVRDSQPRPTARLLLKDGDETREEFPVSAPITIGKDKANLIQLLHPSVDLRHAEVLPHEGRFSVRDLGAAAGVFVNGARVREASLDDGDELKIGEIRFIFLNPPEKVLPGQDIAIRYTHGGQEMQSLAASLPAEPAASGLAAAADPQAALHELSRMSKIVDLGRELASSMDVAIVLDRALDGLFDNVAPSRAAIMLRHASTGELYAAAARTKEGKERASISISRTIVTEAIRRRQAVLIADTASLRVDAEHTIRRKGIRSAICVPLMFNGEPMGAIYLDSVDLRKQFTDSDMRLVAGVAGMAGVALVNARLVARISQERQLRKDLESRRTVEGWASGLPGPEPRDVAVLVLRMVDNAQMMERPSSDRAGALLAELLGILEDRIAQAGGAIIGIQGASILAVWGLTQPGPSDTSRAVAAAFELKEMFAQLNTARSRRGLEPIWMSFAVACGRVLAGPIAFRTRIEPAIVGAPVDAALLLASQAGHDQVLATEPAFTRVASKVEGAARPAAHPAEGPEIACYLLERAKTRATSSS